jgi:tetratricopeptide (TPR) repeat protein
MKRIRMTVALLSLSSSLALLLPSCSSAPKRTMERTAVTDAAYSRLALANTELAKGDIVSAKNDADGAYKAALSVDNADLLTKVCLTRVTVATSSGARYASAVASAATAGTNAATAGTSTATAGASTATAGTSATAAGKSATTAGASATTTGASTAATGTSAVSAQAILDEAKKYAARSSDPDTLGAICSLYEARLLIGGKDTSSSESISQALSLCNTVESKLQKQKEYLAYLYRTRGELYALQHNSADAEKQFLAAASLHTSERYLSEIGLDWYLAAKAYAAEGKKSEAVQALNQALSYDRLDENTAGIGADYYGLAAVLLKGAPTAEEKKQAAEYAKYSAAVYEAGGFSDYAKKSTDLAASIQ